MTRDLGSYIFLLFQKITEWVIDKVFEYAEALINENVTFNLIAAKHDKTHVTNLMDRAPCVSPDRWRIL